MTNAISQVFKKSVESYYEDLKICQVLLSAVDVLEREKLKVWELLISHFRGSMEIRHSMRTYK